MSGAMDARLAAAAELVREGSVVSDIGADHGYLVCHLVASGKCPAGIACDINEKPLARAKETIAKQGLDGKVRALRSDGLSGLAPMMDGDIVILGMGGELIGEIILAQPWTRNPALHFVLQPMTKAERLRRTLCAEGFSIREERVARVGRFLYTVISAYYTGQKWEADDLFAWTGRVWYNEDNLSKAYLARIAGKLRKKAEGMVRSAHTAAEADYWQQLAGQVGRKAGII